MAGTLIFNYSGDQVHMSSFYDIFKLSTKNRNEKNIYINQTVTVLLRVLAEFPHI